MESPLKEEQIDRQNPWPGLEGFEEASATLFKGRDREIGEMQRLIKTERLSVLFGKSGMGKSSLLRAGVFPALRRIGFVPIRIRLKHDERDAELIEQVKAEIAEVIHEGKIDADEPSEEDSLWEYFHRKDLEWWDAANRLVTPVLVLDQFEEVLTQGRENPDRRARAAAFLTGLEDLVEHRIPDAVAQRFEKDPSLAEHYDFYKQDFRVVLSLREDFLPELEGFHDRLNGILTNRFRLLPMSGLQALDVVLKPAPGLVDEPTAIEIVERVSRARHQPPPESSLDRQDLAARSVEPALLSVLCSELNRTRRERGLTQITPGLVNQQEVQVILRDFYERGTSDLPEEVHDFLEQKLVTEGGVRNRYPREDALELEGLAPHHLARLIDARILRCEISNGVPWLEFTHDRLASIAEQNRDSRREKKESEHAVAAAAERERVAVEQLRASKQHHRTVLYGIVAVLALSLLAWWLINDSKRTKQALASVKKQNVTDERNRQSKQREEDAKKREAETKQLKREADAERRMSLLSREMIETRAEANQTLKSLPPSVVARDTAEPEAIIDSAAAVPASLENLLKAKASEKGDSSRDQVLLQASRGLILYRIGQLSKAEAVLSEARDGLEKLRKTDADDQELGLRLTDVCFTLGDIVRERILTGSKTLRQSVTTAETEYKIATQVIGHFLSQPGEVVSWKLLQADLADHEGDLKKVSKDIPAALALYERARDIRATLLASADAANSQVIRLAIARSWNKAGNAYFTESSDDAGKSYNKTLEVLDKLLAEPMLAPTVHDDADQLRGIVYENLGKVHVRKKRWKEAQEAFAEEVACLETLYRRDPGNLKWRALLADGLKEQAYLFMSEVPEVLKKRWQALPLAMKAVVLSDERDVSKLRTLSDAYLSTEKDLRKTQKQLLNMIRNDVIAKVKRLESEGPKKK